MSSYLLSYFFFLCIYFLVPLGPSGVSTKSHNAGCDDGGDHAEAVSRPVGGHLVVLGPPLL